MGNKNSVDKSYHKYDSSFKTSKDTDKDDINDKESCMSYYFNNSGLDSSDENKQSKSPVVPKKTDKKCEYEKCKYPNCNYETCNQNCDINKKKSKQKPKQKPKDQEITEHEFSDSDEAECDKLEDWIKN